MEEKISESAERMYHLLKFFPSNWVSENEKKEIKETEHILKQLLCKMLNSKITKNQTPFFKYLVYVFALLGEKRYSWDLLFLMERTEFVFNITKKFKPISEMQSRVLLNKQQGESVKVLVWNPKAHKTQYQKGTCEETQHFGQIPHHNQNLSQSPWINGKECFKSTAKAYLLVYVVRPEPGLSSLVWVTRQKRRFIAPNLINILNYYQRLTNGLSIVDQNWDFLMNWVHLKKQRALLPQVLLSIFILETLLCQGKSDPHTKHARPEIQHDNLVCHCY